MKASAFVLAGLIILTRVYVPIGMTLVGQWPVRFSLFLVWMLAVRAADGTGWAQFLSTARARSAELMSLAIWIAVLAVFWLAQGGQHELTSTLLTGYLGALPFYFLGTYYFAREDKGRGMALVIVLVVGATCLLAVPSVWRNPALVRMGAINSTAATRSLGIGSYGDLTAFAIALPFLITAALQQRNLLARVLGVTACAATIAMLMIATFSGLILLTGLAVAGCVLYYLLFGGLRLRRIVWTSTAVVVVGLAATQLLPGVYGRAAFRPRFDKLARTYVTLSGVLSGQSRDPTLRYSLMLMSLDVFLRNPAFGVAVEATGAGTPGTGGHSSWMDALANYGLLGGVPYVLFHLLVLRRIWQAWRDERGNALYWGSLLSCVLFLFYGMFNVTTQPATVVLFFYVIGASGQRSGEPSRGQRTESVHRPSTG